QALPAHGQRRAGHRSEARHAKILRLVRPGQGVTKRRPDRVALPISPASRASLILPAKKNEREVRMIRRRTALAAGLATLAPLAARGQSTWKPTKPIRMIVPYGPGGS